MQASICLPANLFYMGWYSFVITFFIYWHNWLMHSVMMSGFLVWIKWHSILIIGCWISVHSVYLTSCHSVCWSILLLTHLPLDKMAAILADNIFKCIIMNLKLHILNRISLKFATKGPIDNKTVLVQVLVWRQTGDKSLPEPMLNEFTDAYMRH